MANFMEIGSYISLLNTDTSVMMYYSKKESEFVVLEAGVEIPDDYVEVPFVGEIEAYARECFWERLGHSAWTCPDAAMFHSYIRRHDLAAEYYASESTVVLPYMKVWAKYNGIALNWDNFTVI